MIDFKKIEKLIIAQLQMELIGQGHSATGSLNNSFEGRSIETPNSIVMEILMDDYGKYVNDGRKPGGKKVPIAVLVDWIERKALASGDKEIKNLAFAIQNAIHKEGAPTSGSFKFSNNGRRAGFIDFVVDNKLDFVLDEFGDEIFEQFDNAVAEVVKDFNKQNI